MANRKANGEGSIYKRNGKFVYQISTPQGRKTFTGATRQEVVERRKQFEQKQEELEALKRRMTGRGLSPKEAEISLVQWVSDWIQLYKRPPMTKVTTYASYLAILDTHLKPFFGNMPLVSITNADIQLFYNYLSTNGKLDGSGGLSPKSIRNIHNMLRSALQKAVGKILEFNPANDTDRPSVPKPDIQILSPEEMRLFLRAVLEEQHRDAIIVCLLTGMRMGELLALTWQDVDFEQNEIRVNKNLVRSLNLEVNARTKTKLIVQPSPKTKSSNRSIPMTDEVSQLLFVAKEEQARRQRQEREDSKKEKRDCRILNPDNLVFPTSVGTHIDPRSFEKLVKRVVERSGVSYVSVHALRHPYVKPTTKNFYLSY